MSCRWNDVKYRRFPAKKIVEIEARADRDLGMKTKKTRLGDSRSSRSMTVRVSPHFVKLLRRFHQATRRTGTLGFLPRQEASLERLAEVLLEEGLFAAYGRASEQMSAAAGSVKITMSVPDELADEAERIGKLHDMSSRSVFELAVEARGALEAGVRQYLARKGKSRGVGRGGRRS